MAGHPHLQQPDDDQHDDLPGHKLDGMKEGGGSKNFRFGQFYQILLQHTFFLFLKPFGHMIFVKSISERSEKF